MDGSDRAVDDRTFRISFGGEAMSRLRERVRERLKEVMGDYTDDTLVEYVLVLLRNGRSKDEARGELNVFLGDDSASFVSWLWDHLSSNWNLYAQSKESPLDEVAKRNRGSDDHHGRQNLHPQYGHKNGKSDSENERELSPNSSRSRRNKEWKGLVQEDSNPFPLRRTITKILHPEQKNNTRPAIRQSLSPKPHTGRKRSWEDGRQPVKRDAAVQSVIGASRRLLQFAVRDAVRTVQRSSTRPEPALKRLRSVVSTSTEDSLLDERPQRLRSISRVPVALSTALKAVAEAAEDVTRDRFSGSVFGRLGHSTHDAEPIKQSTTEPILEDGEYADHDQITELTRADYCQSDYSRDCAGDMTMINRGSTMPEDSASDNDGYDNVGIVRNPGLNTSISASSENKDKKSLMLQYSVAQDAAEVVRNTRLVDQEPHSSAAANTSSKIVNISVNVNTWKPPNYQVPSEVENRVAVDKSVVTAGKTNAQHPKESDTTLRDNEVVRAGIQKEPQKTLTPTPGSYTTSRPSDDVDSRTVFVSNVHFAATKDSLSRHFNKFGEVLKVIIINDAATGQPKGSAYVEFLRKESAESALSLNGTSFLSRSLKVVRKSSMHQDAAAMMAWPRMARASSFTSRFSRAAFSRGVLPGAFRARLPIIPGARSLQWKREAQPTGEGSKNALNAPLSSGNAPSPTGRNLTYVRSESKVGSSSGPA